MKEVTNSLEKHLNEVKNIISCDLYRLVLANGAEYYYADFDIDVLHNNKTYLHNAMILKRRNISIDDKVAVDSLTVTCYVSTRDAVESKAFIKAAHDGTLDRARLYLSRAFFDLNNSIIGVIDLFGGNVEVKSAGGIKIELTVKAATQGLHMDFPIRKYYPQGTYSVSGDTIVSSAETDKTTLVAPFIPLKEVLL